MAGVVFVYFWSRGAICDLIYANVIWPSHHYGAVNAAPYAQGILQYYWKDWATPTGSARWLVGMAAVLITPFLLVTALPALLLIFGIRHRAKTVRSEVLLYWLCGWALWLSELHRKDIFHLVYGSPLLIILCIHLLGECRGKVADMALQVLAISAACLSGFNLFIVLVAHPITTRVGSVAMFKDDPALTFLDEHVAPGGEIFAYPYCPMYYLLSATTNPTRYSILLYGYNTPSQFQEVIRVLDQRRVRYALWDINFQGKVATIFPASQHMRPDELIIEPYLESHYKLVKVVDGVRIMERKSEDHADQR